VNPANPFTIRRLTVIEAVITDAALDCKQIAAATFTSEAYALKLMKMLHEEKLVHIVKWKLCKRTYAAVYAWGGGRDARRPRPKTATEGQRAYRARIRKDPEANEFYLARMRAKDRANRAAKVPRTWFAALEATC
jgi:hypothetical protein